MIITIRLKGRLLNEHIEAMLVQTVLRMYRAQEPTGSFSTGLCEGRVTTEFKTVLLGAFGGPLFVAELEHEGGRTTLHFILNAELIDRLCPACVESVSTQGQRVTGRSRADLN